MIRNLSENGLNLIKKYEGLRLRAYKCTPSEKYFTIGYGHYGADVYDGMTINYSDAEELLKQDVARFVDHVNAYMGIYNFNQNQFDALVSFAYNVGNIKQLTQSGRRKLQDIPKSMPLYCRSGGIKLAGLVRRREEEVAIFNKPVTEVPKPTKDISTIAIEVIQGKWGNGSERKKKLTEAGYDYRQVQNLVNQMLKV